MGSVAGSGGYWISMNADKIIATKTTITGSIGVVGMKFNLRNFFSEWLGITFDEIQTSKSSEMFSQFHSIEKGSHIDQKYNQLLDEYYSSFKKRVSESRNIDPTQVDLIAQGKIYSGEDALKLKLVDSLGGFSHAINETKKLLNIEKETVTLEVFPKPLTLIESILEKPPQNSEQRDKKGVNLYKIGIKKINSSISGFFNY